MAVFKIVEVGDPVLREKAQPVTKITPALLRLLDDMTETMYAYHGVGLAAPQVGVSKRVIVVDAGKGLYQLINPEIIAVAGSETDREGCLSIPGVWGEVTRAAAVTVRGLNRSGETVEVEAEGFFARALQHEIDHLDGILFIDRALKIVKG
ncbi:peptide deformylase [Thermodesulfitimonas autotrophica]|uniref:Peptide deformylase n=1 Tax=Thermodesulfitimonas autotrophica TaxID=1894989 RepID=A0A3N5B0Z7_9THEO|nr:peptide deformylase [Thermodesulfitimonas autotrophica]RPF49300.1 peptide deformylase [Thermodesulfitimonas autotrophica]